MTKLRKIRERKWISGVSAGIGYWMGIPAWLVRIAWVIAALCYGTGVLAYLLLWIFMPAWEATPPDYEERAGG